MSSPNKTATWLVLVGAVQGPFWQIFATFGAQIFGAIPQITHKFSRTHLSLVYPNLFLENAFPLVYTPNQFELQQFTYLHHQKLIVFCNGGEMLAKIICSHLPLSLPPPSLVYLILLWELGLEFSWCNIMKSWLFSVAKIICSYPPLSLPPPSNI